MDLDLEKYYDIYEISQSDVDLAADVEISKNCCLDDVGNIIDLKAWLEKLRIVRRVFFCSLLALDAGSGKSDYPRWIAAIEIMKSLSTETARATDDINEVLQEEDGKASCSIIRSKLIDNEPQNFLYHQPPKSPSLLVGSD